MDFSKFLLVTYLNFTVTFLIKPVICSMIKFIATFLCLLFVGLLPMNAQYKETKERKKMWRKSGKRRKNREAFNPYLDKKNKDKPSSKLAAEEKKGVRKMRRDFKREQRKNKKKTGH